MPKRNEQEELIFKSQGLSEAIHLLSQYEEALQGLADRPEDRGLKERLESLNPSLRDIQTRFDPHLATPLGLFAAQVASLDARLEEDTVRPTTGELRAVTDTLANLQSELRVTHTEIERFEKWVATGRDDLLLEIAAVTDAIDNLRNIFTYSNSLRAGNPQADIFRNTVIALLSSALEELKAPAVSVKRLGGIVGLLRRVMAKSAEKQLGEIADNAIKTAIDRSEDLYESIKEMPGMDGFF